MPCPDLFLPPKDHEVWRMKSCRDSALSCNTKSMRLVLALGIALGALLAACQPDPPTTAARSIDSPQETSVSADRIPDEPPKYPATLAGRAILPYESRLTIPADLPPEMRISGKFTNPVMPVMDSPGAFRGASFISDPSAPRFTGILFPVEGQPLQGFSGMTALGDGTFIATLDNGFGTKTNSKDALLAFVRLDFRWETNTVEVLEESLLHDPDRILPFEIVHGATEKRYLTGSDLDPESIQVVGSDVFIGEEFGPFVLRTDLEGRITGFYEARLDNDTIRSKSDSPLPETASTRQLHKSSTGFEGMALSHDGQYLFPLLEGPLVDPNTGEPESLDGKPVLRVLKFDTGEQQFTSDSYRYLLEQEGNNIGGFNFINEHEALVIERDWGEGDASLACGEEVTASCFNFPAGFKRVYKVSFEGVGPGETVRKLGYIDLLDIRDGDGTFMMPFVTIENVVRVDENHIIVANDNNYGFSAGRTLGVNDDNEVVLLEISDFLKQAR